MPWNGNKIPQQIDNPFCFCCYLTIVTSVKLICHNLHLLNCFDWKFRGIMDFPGAEDALYNWSTYYQDPFTGYDTNNVIYPNSQVG